MIKAPPGTPDESDAIIRDLKRQIAELRSVIDTCEDSIAKLERKVQYWQEKADSAREYGKEARIRENQANDARIHEQVLRNAAEAENARLRALPLKDEVERVLDDARVWISENVRPSDAVGNEILCEIRALLPRLRTGEQEGWPQPSEPFDTWQDDQLAFEIERLKLARDHTNKIIEAMIDRRVRLAAAREQGGDRG